MMNFILTMKSIHNQQQTQNLTKHELKPGHSLQKSNFFFFQFNFQNENTENFFESCFFSGFM